MESHTPFFISLSVGLLLVIHLPGLSTERIKDKIYYDSGIINMCFRRLNATHQTGCTSERGGNTGILHYVQTTDDLDWLIENGPHAPYVVLLASLMFSNETMTRLHSSGKINGILVIYNVTETPPYFSPESPCPNSNHELYKGDERYEGCKKNVWNPQGNSFLSKDIPYPIVSMHNESHIDFFITECYEKYNKPIGSDFRSYPLCGAQVNAPMDAIKDTPTCLRRGKTRNFNPQTFCDPLGDKNVYSFVHPIKKNDSENSDGRLQNKSLIMATAKLDVAGLFEHLYPGADQTIVGFVTLIAAAEALYKVRDRLDPSTDRPIMFTFFEGESYDYMGSTRMVYDMEHSLFPSSGDEDDPSSPRPIYPHHIGSFLELSQVAIPQDNTLWMHSDPRSRAESEVNTTTQELEQLLSKHGQEMNLTMQATDASLPLPPASLQSFLKAANFSGVVIADHNREYNNKFYSSRLDLPENVNYDFSEITTEYTSTNLSQHLARLATVVSRSLFELSKGQVIEDVKINANETVVSQLLYCFFVSPRCELFNFTLDKDDAKNLQRTPYDLYVGVDRSSTPNHIRILVSRVLSYFMGDATALDEDDCKDAEDSYHQYIWMQGPVNKSDPEQHRVGLCMKTTTDQSLAKSPAFNDGYDWSSGVYAGWSESIWGDYVPTVRVFLVPDKNYEIMTLCIGVAVIVVSLPLVFVLNRRAPMIFAPN